MPHSRASAALEVGQGLVLGNKASDDLVVDPALLLCGDRIPSGGSAEDVAAVASLVVHNLVGQRGLPESSGKAALDQNGGSVAHGPVDGMQACGKILKCERQMVPLAERPPRLPLSPARRFCRH
jgi:hypothetical protein